MNTRSVMFRLCTGLAGMLLAAFGLVVVGAGAATADTAPPSGTPATVSADALPTWQVNGVVWSQVVVGNTVYVTGSFTQARPPGVAVGGAGSVTANNIFAYDITTGNRVASFNHSLNAQGNVISASPDGSRIYVGGDFTTVDGATHNHIAAFNTSDNSLVAGFTASASQRVAGIAATATTVYIGGNFFSVNGSTRTRLAQVTASTGALTSWKATADNDSVTALVLTPDGSKLIVGGKFTTLNGVAASGMGALDASSGATLTWLANQTIQDGGTNSNCGILSLKTDGSYIYGSGYAFGCGNFEGSFKADPSTGALIYANDCHGDTYDVAPVAGALYTVSHVHDCAAIGGFPQTDSDWSVNQRHAMAFTNAATTVNRGPDRYGWNYDGVPASSILQWFPTIAIGSYTKQYQSAWAVSATSKYVVLGGEFPSVNGTAQQGLVRFAVSSIAPNKRGPAIVTKSAAPNPPVQAASAKAMPDGSVRLSWQAAVDMDNATLTYNVYRGSSTTPIYTKSQDSNYWTYPTMGFRDTTGLTPGKTTYYTIKASDPFGNTTTIGNLSAVPTSPMATSAYSKDVVNDGATAYWRLGESSGTTAYDYAGFNDATQGTGVTNGAPGAIAGDPDTADTFDGTSNGTVVSPQMAATPAFSVEAWVKTTTTSGGKIVGYGSSSSGDSGSYDRHVYMDNAGHIWFGVYPGSVQTVNSTKSYNDGQWHHVVATQSSDGMALYIDGVRVGTNSGATGAQDYTGFWRIGGDNLGGWPNQPSSNYLAGSIDDVAVYPAALSLTQVRQHYTDAGGSTAGPAAPTDAYGKAVYASQPDLFWRLNETSGSTATDYSGNQADGVTSGGITRGVSSGVAGGDKAYAFDGSSGTIASQSAVSNPSVYSEELWFNTTTTHGGKLIGFGDTQSGLSGNYDRHVYMENSGQLTFGVWTGQPNTITSSNRYNDGKWHYLVASQGPGGMTLYVDGVSVGTNPQTQAQGYTGYWRVGGDTSWGGDSPFFDGTIDEVAVYSSVLTSSEVAAHYKAGGGSVNTPPKAAFTSSTSKLKASLDASGSTDEGPLTYAWDYGDNTTGTGVSPDHTYGAAGTYTVTLTVTDAGGLTDTVSHDVTVTANQAPTASFTSTTSDLKVSVDGSASTDADGTVASYAWDFGDGSTGTGATASHTYAAGGTYPVTLTVTDNDGATGVLTKQVTVTKANQAPTAAFTVSTNNLSVAVDGSASSDPDGTVSSYAWSWGDSTADGSGVASNHTYASAGTYTVKLTVTDNGGASSSVTKSVTATAPANATLASDAFSRTVSNGWGSADTGGAWTPRTSASGFSVANGVGTITFSKAGSSPQISLNSLSSTSTDTTLTVSTRSAATGSGTYLSVIGREVPNVGGYYAKVQLRSDGAVTLGLFSRNAAGTESVVSASKVVSGLTVPAGGKVKVRFVATGTNPTTLRAKVWLAGASEPTSWTATATDATAAYQAAGRLSLLGYLSGTATAPAVLDVDDLTVTQAQ